MNEKIRALGKNVSEQSLSFYEPGQATAWLQAAAWLRMGPMGPRGLGPWALWAPGALGPTPFRQHVSKMLSNATWFRQHFPKCSQMRHGFDNMFQNAFKYDMVSTTCSKMLSNATWFRQHVPNLPTYQPTNLHLYLYLFLVHAQHSCACTTLLCMHWRGQGPRPGPNKKRPPGPARGAGW